MKPEDYYKLALPFNEEDIEWRVDNTGINKNGDPYALALAYLTSRAVQDRFDQVCGPDGWYNEIIPMGNDSYLCKLSVRFDYPDGTSKWITKMDGSDSSNFEQTKGGISGAIKRAAVLWGVGRYLYKLKNSWAVFSNNGKYSSKIKDKYYKWNPPKMPSWALPENNNSKGSETEQTPQPSAKPSLETAEKVFDNPNGYSENELMIKEIYGYLNEGIIPPSKKETVDRAIAEKDLEKLNVILKWARSRK